MNNEIVSKIQADILKRLGFNLNTKYFWQSYFGESWVLNYNLIEYNHNDSCELEISAPSINSALIWLRDFKGCYIYDDPDFCEFSESYKLDLVLHHFLKPI
jgi:hypothetical protein